MLDAFTQNPDIKGVFNHKDEMVRRVISALRHIGKVAPAGRTRGSRRSPYGTPLALECIRAGTQDASVKQDPYAMPSK